MSQQSTTDLRRRVCDAGIAAVEELIKIAEEEIIMTVDSVMISEDGIEAKSDKSADLSADKLTRAAQAKKIAITDAFEILNMVDSEQAKLKSLEEGVTTTSITPESRAKQKKG